MLKTEPHSVYDIGAYPEASISAKIAWRVTNPANEPRDEEERRQKEILKEKKGRDQKDCGGQTKVASIC
jgi:hypothetical protein